ncbi:B-cell CLL/lymphoma 6 member B protein-like [Centroberyx affinis]|uniref:B-cell CLL/lymphoma 6 member B protein-like n=1 Tax=Centroberyx affinis TaxID=166261 RepID=UPI003A5BD5D7
MLRRHLSAKLQSSPVVLNVGSGDHQGSLRRFQRRGDRRGDEEEEEEEEEERREVGVQWESPEERREERREVGCQSEAAERRDAAVQVDLPNQPGCCGVVCQCVGVRADGAQRTDGRLAPGQIDQLLLSRTLQTADPEPRSARPTVSVPQNKRTLPDRPIGSPPQDKPTRDAARPAADPPRDPTLSGPADKTTGCRRGEPSPTARRPARPAPPDASGRKKILVLSREGGRKVFLVMGAARGRTAEPAETDRAQLSRRAPRSRTTAGSLQRSQNAGVQSSRSPPNGTAASASSPPPVTRSTPPNRTPGESNAFPPLRTAPPTLPPPGAALENSNAPLGNKILVMSVAGRKVLLVMNASHQPPARPPPRPPADRSPPGAPAAPPSSPLPPAPPPYVCEFCGLRYASVGNVRRHRRRIHGTVSAFICRVCGKGLSRRAQLARHSLLHRGARLLSCPVCRRTFGHQEALRQHRKRFHRRRSAAE